MRARSLARWTLRVAVVLGAWLGFPWQAAAQTPTPTPTEPQTPNPFADLEPVSLLMWVASALVALVAVLYAMDRERRKHEG